MGVDGATMIKSAMMLTALELDLFHRINGLDLPSWLDQLWVLSRDARTWIPLYIGVVAWLIYRFASRGAIVVVWTCLLAGLSDFSTSSLLKPAFDRLRPCQDMSLQENIQVRVRCGRGKSMPSSHAANHMAIAFFFMLMTRRSGRYGIRILAALAILWALLIGLAQVYVGVHYPGDIAAGFLWGGLLAWSFYRLYDILPARWHIGREQLPTA